MTQFASRGGARASLSVDNVDPNDIPRMVNMDPAEPDVSGGDQFSAVINVHDSTLAQIEAAVAGNQHQFDPHPADPTKSVRRHPLYIVAEDYSNLDEQGRPAPGKPLELDLTTIRQIYSSRPGSNVSPDGPPEDGSHIRVAGMSVIAEKDQAGNPTGRVIFGDAEASE